MVLAPLAAFTVTLALVRYLANGSFLRILDYPNSRSLHSRAVPRTGGLGLMSGILVSWALVPDALPLLLWTSVMLLVAISFADDVFGLPVWVRLLLHGAVAASLSISMLSDTHGWVAAIMAAVAITWMLNLYNFMDGSDGLAGGMALIGFSSYGMVAWSAGNEPFAMINFCIAAAAGAFLLFNFHPARIFMGDAGSIPLGFLAAALGLTGWINGDWPLWLPALVFSPFIADASITLVKRGLRGAKVWQAHREHYYQRMVQSGLGHRNTALLAYVLMLATGASAMWAMTQNTSVQLGVCIAWSGIYAVMMLVSDRYWKRRPSGS
ncbi:UDP-N-acetylmuramyl pentapeptide phosphotransferase/UDP-N-acetylglucosamine-1-phosphate transferase [Nitrosovibrio tenuis]|uniref:UDP-N-acetylmuramyl pentapeptide phosphotransferase/UDP-N-acetylglucosamine-1-phosphate transferase n=2 Tax=Nitrosovibrio tenuis TaxID=1233 RepID=A0A1H7GPY6_9PROT|nr:UDP-N-acetylmuramyl pentapeptide phosphotransferase/UDP-N-acetylglucosamine-1-phosphate transferase [Nitrosovibrio tenuis]